MLRKFDDIKAYMNRNKRLKKAGLGTYEKYLKSAAWKKIRKRILTRDGGKCRACGQTAQCVHHTSYSKKVLLGKQDEKLFSLCNSCHRKIEFRPDGTKRMMVETNVILERIIGQKIMSGDTKYRNDKHVKMLHL